MLPGRTTDFYAAELKERVTYCPADKDWLVPPAAGGKHDERIPSREHDQLQYRYFEKPQYCLLLGLWQDVNIWVPERITVDGTKTIATSYSFDRETCLYDKVYIY
jgi:hypothetical protein